MTSLGEKTSLGNDRDFFEFPAGLLRCRLSFPTQRFEKARSSAACTRARDKAFGEFLLHRTRLKRVLFLRRFIDAQFGLSARSPEKFQSHRWGERLGVSQRNLSHRDTLFHFAAHPHDRLKINPSAVASSKIRAESRISESSLTRQQPQRSFLCAKFRGA